jgi:RNA ligase (TIGR02306 family)
MRKLASLVTIEKVEPIENADRLEVATIKGKTWKVVVGKNDFLPGDDAVYFEIDSYLPADDERYNFLKERCLRKFVSKSGEVLMEGIRIKTIKLRGVISQGLLMPADKFPELDEQIEYPGEGTDLTEVLKVKHYDEIAEALRPISGASISAEAYGSFPSAFIPKTDEERIQNLGEYFETMKGREFQVTEKFDGMSVTMFYSPTVDAENPFGVCSRNLRLKPVMSDGSIPLPWQIANSYFVEAALKNLFDKYGLEYAVQGELVGPGINGNRDLYTEHKWFVFRIYDIKAGKFLEPEAAYEIAHSALAVPHVKILAPFMRVFDECPDFDSLMEFAQGKTDRGNEREGIVCKTVEAPYISFKVVSNKYLLKGE